MTTHAAPENATHWLNAAKRLARRVNLGWCLETLTAPLLVTAILTAVGLLIARREFPEIPLWTLAAAVAAITALLTGGCWALAARKFETPAQSLVRIEAAMQLKNALSTAAAGAAPWPAVPPGKIHANLTWQWPRLLIPSLGALALIAAGLLMPISARLPEPASISEQPQSWKQLSNELDHLTKEEVVDEKYLEETRKKLEELKSQNPENWFSHSSLEATDSLKKSHQAESERVTEELEQAEKALENFEKVAGTANEMEKEKILKDFGEALQELENGAMKPNSELLQQMKELGEKGAQGLTKEQTEQLRKNLQDNLQAMKDAAEKEATGQQTGDPQSKGQGEKGEDDGDCDGESEGQNGQGGVQRGPGHDPDVLGKQKNRLDIGERQGLRNEDLSHATPGDLLELQKAEHDVDRSRTGISSGGDTDATGKGGDSVWRDSLDPAEQQTLKRFFE